MAEELFFGFKEGYERYKRKAGIEEPEEEKKEKKRQSSSPSIKIVADDSSIIEDSDLEILQKTRLRNTYDVVYMQSDISFYDKFYNEDDTNVDDLTKEVRLIRKTYKNYPKYLYALYIRELYIDYLYEKYGEYLFEERYRSGIIPEIIPPMPIYNRRADDYELVKNGILDTSELYEDDYDTLVHDVEKLQEEEGIIASDIEVEGDICTDILAINYGNRDVKESSNRITTSVNVSDLENLQRIMKSWYQPEVELTKNDDSDDLFSMTPDKIRYNYINSRLMKGYSEVMRKIREGESLDTPVDPNEMVYDSELNRSMTRKEYESRKIIRLMKDFGWSDVRLMKQFDVGSTYERKILNRKNKNKKKNRKQAMSFMSNLDMGFDDPMDDLEEFKRMLFQ